MKRKARQRLKNKAKIWRKIVYENVFTDYFYEGDLNGICDRIQKFHGVIKKLRDYTILQYKWWGYDPDLRSGDESYGYSSLDYIESNLAYISDRCITTFRLTWLMEVPERVSILQNTK
jgi:hypothetical protein